MASLSEFRLGDEVEATRFTPPMKGERRTRPVVLAVQPDEFIVIESPEALRSWERAVRQTTGLDLGGDSFIGSASESCSAGCTDDCDVC